MTAGHDGAEIVRRLTELAPDMVLTSAYTSSYPKAVKLLRAAKAALPGVVTGIGGVHTHFMYDEVLRRDGDAVDFVIRGEGEVTTPELARCLSAGGDPGDVAGIAFRRGDDVVATPPRPFLTSLDDMPMAWDLVDWELYEFFPLPETNLAVVSSSRGCDQQCSFCSQQVVLAAPLAGALGRGLRRRAADASGHLRRRRHDALRRDADARPRTLGAHPRPADRARPRPAPADGDARRRRLAGRGHPAQVRRGGRAPHLRRRGADGPGDAGPVQEEHPGRTGPARHRAHQQPRHDLRDEPRPRPAGRHARDDRARRSSSRSTTIRTSPSS